MNSDIKISRVDLNLFVVFDAIYRERNLTRASESLYLSQPAMSHALARLRERLDDPLFERSGKQMKPTPYANSIIQRVREGLACFESALTREISFDPATAEREFNIALPPMIEATILHRLASRILQDAPNLCLKSQRITRPEIEPALKRGLIDLAIDIHIPVSEDIIHTPVAQDRLVVMARKNHPLLRPKGSKLSLATYLSAQHVFVSTRHYGLGAEDYALSKLGKKRNISITCQHYFAASNIVRNTDLLLTVPESYTLTLANSDFSIYPLPIKMEGLELHTYALERHSSDPAIQWLKSILLETLEDLSGNS